MELWKQLPPHPNIVQKLGFERTFLGVFFTLTFLEENLLQEIWDLLRLIDSFQEGGWFLMVLELVGGGDLFTVSELRTHTWKPCFCLDIGSFE